MIKKIALLISMASASFLGASYSPAAQQVMQSNQSGPRITAAQLTQYGYYAMPAVALGVAYGAYHNKYVASEKRLQSTARFMERLNKRFTENRDQARDSKHSAEKLDKAHANRLKILARTTYISDIPLNVNLEKSSIFNRNHRNVTSANLSQFLCDNLDEIAASTTRATDARREIIEVTGAINAAIPAKIQQIQQNRKTTIKWGLGITATLGALYAGIKWFWPGSK